MIWVHLGETTDFERFCSEFTGASFLGPPVRGPAHGDFFSYHQFDVNDDALKTFMKERGITVLSLPNNEESLAQRLSRLYGKE